MAWGHLRLRHARGGRGGHKARRYLVRVRPRARARARARATVRVRVRVIGLGLGLDEARRYPSMSYIIDQSRRCGARRGWRPG